MTAFRTVTYCARCGALETMHEIRRDGTRGKRVGGWREVDGKLASGVACPGYEPGRVEERPPEDEQRRRLDAVLALHRVVERWGEPFCLECDRVVVGGACATVRAARGET